VAAEAVTLDAAWVVTVGAVQAELENVSIVPRPVPEVFVA
jgi:hypothetical protein